MTQLHYPPGVAQPPQSGDVTSLVDELGELLLRIFIDRRDGLKGDALTLENSAQAIVLIGLAKEYKNQFNPTQWTEIIDHGRNLGDVLMKGASR